ncbi:MAG: ABC transporter ATP-binding protein [Gemmatimonadota bacterium]|jgi:ATP-binding cassette subfamily B protein|nr:ABC transporter ATP-binding protein [Gemmatimonadota bacterium]MDP6801871.1 ABC transporter ATP-binding protein [Gemmatimonadota bacterium]MDP7031597.1 ABC transporter ATP-binding protein [Gemmatimonadota bacterium]
MSVLRSFRASRDTALLKRLFPLLAPRRAGLAGSFLLLFASGALDLTGPYLTKLAIDKALPAHDTALLGKIVGLFVCVLLLSFAARYAQNLLMQETGQRLMRDLRSRLFAHLQRMDIRYFDRHPVGGLVTRLTNDVEALNELLSSGLVSIVADAVTLTGITIILFVMDPGLAFITFLALPPVIFVSTVFRRRARAGFRATRERIAGIHSVMHESLSGSEVVKLFSREHENDRLFDVQNAGCRTAWLDTLQVFALFFPIIQFLLAVALALVLMSGGHRILHDALTFGELVAFLQYVQRFFGPLRDLSEKFNVLQAAGAAGDRILRVLDTPALEDYRERPSLPSFSGSIEFDRVSFRYRHEEPVLRDVSFQVDPGQRVALVGPTGSGKSTVISLVLGLLNPDSGRVLIDHQDLKDFDPRSLRRHTGTVPQDVFLFSTDVGWNVRLGDSSPGCDDDIRTALETSRALSVVDALPQRLNEPLGERGHRLSAGQRQLLSFARALYAQPDLLILDEATSSVDPATETLIRDGLDRLLRGRTCLIVAHRLKTVQHCDRILVFRKGQIVEEGTHEELTRAGGLYARLAQLQFQD